MADDPGEELLARNIVDVHGAEAATIVRANARGGSGRRATVAGEILDQGARHYPAPTNY